MAFDFSRHFDVLLASAAFGEEVIFTSPSGATTRVEFAGWASMRTEQRDDAGVSGEVRTARVMVRAADLAHVERGYTVTRSMTGETWTVVEVDKFRGAAWRLRVERALTTDSTQGKYRRA